MKIGDGSIRLNADPSIVERQRVTPVNEIEREQAIAVRPDMKHPGVGLIFADVARAALAGGWLPWPQQKYDEWSPVTMRAAIARPAGSGVAAMRSSNGAPCVVSAAAPIHVSIENGATPSRVTRAVHVGTSVP